MSLIGKTNGKSTRKSTIRDGFGKDKLWNKTHGQEVKDRKLIKQLSQNVLNLIDEQEKDDKKPNVLQLCKTVISNY